MVSLGVHLCGGPIPVLSDLAPETRDSGGGVVRGDPLSSVPKKVWEPLKRPGRGCASIRLTRGAQLAPLEYTRVQAVTGNLHWLPGGGQRGGGGGEAALRAGTLEVLLAVQPGCNFRQVA